MAGGAGVGLEVTPGFGGRAIHQVAVGSLPVAMGHRLANVPFLFGHGEDAGIEVGVAGYRRKWLGGDGGFEASRPEHLGKLGSGESGGSRSVAALGVDIIIDAMAAFARGATRLTSVRLVGA